ncbi:hypothetical protein E2320_009398 [Naja naja]|nr:hypothetical protein E2320_009398 [Naja naja]
MWGHLSRFCSPAALADRILGNWKTAAFSRRGHSHPDPNGALVSWHLLGCSWVTKGPSGSALAGASHALASAESAASSSRTSPSGKTRWAGEAGVLGQVLHSYLQRFFSSGGRFSPSMARRWLMCLWMAVRQRVSREGTGGRGRRGLDQRKCAEMQFLLNQL